jgi:hypothetical protein
VIEVAKKMVTLDDLDPSVEAAETIDYGLDGFFYEIDLSEANAQKLREALEPFVAVSRRVHPKDAVRRAAAVGNGGQHGPGDFDPSVVRAWAQQHGIEVSDKGRVPEHVVQQWRRATAAAPSPAG